VNINTKLHEFFGMSYASFLTVPRVLLQEMPEDWQNRFAEMLYELSEEFPHAPCSFRVQAVDGISGKLVTMPHWLKDYRHPDEAALDAARRKRWENDNP
jgi:hypothetical protein